MEDFDLIKADSRCFDIQQVNASSPALIRKKIDGEGNQENPYTSTYCILSEYEEMNPSKRSHMEDVHFVIPSLFPEDDKKKNHLR